MAINATKKIKQSYETESSLGGGLKRVVEEGSSEQTPDDYGGRRWCSYSRRGDLEGKAFQV